ncbi:hypothetical protein [Shewanella sp. 1180_01]|uniref:hypothetical protein n=1 Tax=Shewanella sp. 1180_01 TaxID=2604451 RepID=UPI00406409DB
MDWLSIIGSVASIGGAIWAWKEAVKSSKSATKAEQIKAQMINQRKTSELSELKPLVLDATDSVKRYSTTMVSSLIGADETTKETEAAKIQTLLNKIVEFSDYFPENFANQFFETSHSSLQSFLEANSPGDSKKHGMDLHKQMVDFSSVLRKNLTEKKESTT